MATENSFTFVQGLMSQRLCPIFTMDLTNWWWYVSGKIHLSKCYIIKETFWTHFPLAGCPNSLGPAGVAKWSFALLLFLQNNPRSNNKNSLLSLWFLYYITMVYSTRRSQTFCCPFPQWAYSEHFQMEAHYALMWQIETSVKFSYPHEPLKHSKLTVDLANCSLCASVNECI